MTGRHADKPGWSTSEFWLAVLVVICATALRLTHDIDHDAWMVVVGTATGGYTLSRGIAKK